MGTSEPVRAPREVSRTRGHRLAKPRSDRIVVEFRALKSAISGSTMGLGGKIIGVSFAAKLRRGSTRTCSAACFRRAHARCVCVPSPSTGSGHRKCGNATGRGRRCTDATRGFSGRLWDWAFSNPVKRTGAALARVVPRSELTRRAKAGLMRSNKRGRRVAGIYSITSSAREVGREDREPGEISLGSLHIENEPLTLNIAELAHFHAEGPEIGLARNI